MLGFLHPLQTLLASSSIFDGVVERIEGDVIVFRGHHQPYSSPPTMRDFATHKDGAFKLRRRPLNSFLTYYIDEVPVTKEQMKAFLKPGMRMALMANRKRWYFLHVTARSQGSHLGMIKEIEGNRLTLERPQFRSSTILEKPDLNFANYPHLETDVRIDADAVVLREGKTIPWKQAGLQADPKEYAMDISEAEHQDKDVRGRVKGFAANGIRSRNSLLIQAPRKKMRVELIPPNWGDWDELVHSANSSGYPDRKLHELLWQNLSLITGPWETKSANTRPPAEMKQRNGEERIETSKGFSAYRLAGRYPGEGAEYWAPTYWKGVNPIIDGMYASELKGLMTTGITKPGRMVVCFQRRGRITTDRVAFTFDQPVAWGIVEKIEGNRVTLVAPDIAGVPVSGKQTLGIEPDAEYFHLGLEAPRESVLKKGALLQIYPPRPQRIVVNGGQ